MSQRLGILIGFLLALAAVRALITWEPSPTALRISKVIENGTVGEIEIGRDTIPMAPPGSTRGSDE